MKRLLAVFVSIVVVFSFAGQALAKGNPYSHGNTKSQACKQKGDGTIQRPFNLCVAADFELMHTYPDKNFELKANIKLSDFYTAANPWRPIPNFAGSLNGKNHTVSQVNGAGFIVQNNGKVNNLKLKVDIYNYYIAGGIAGTNYGEITNSRVDGNVSGRYDVGAIAARNYGVIKHSQSSGSISVDMSGGGLVGVNHGTITHSSSSASVNGSYGIGGLVGINAGTIISAASSGSVDGYSGVGGLVGDNYAEGKIQFSIATGNVYVTDLSNPNLFYGNLVGHNWVGGQVLHSKGFGKVLVG